jgi:hypothetical protein
MFPIFKADLPLSHISDYWSRDIKPPASSSELLDLLIRAWWRGELFLGDAHSRFEFLKKMFARSWYRVSETTMFGSQYSRDSF